MDRPGLVALDFADGLPGRLSPPARNRTEQFLKLLAGLAVSEPFIAPNQKALETILAPMRAGS